MSDGFIPELDGSFVNSGRNLNKFSSPDEVKAHYKGWDMDVALRGHIARFYPTEPLATKLEIPTLEKIIRTLSTKAMETL